MVSRVLPNSEKLVVSSSCWCGSLGLICCLSVRQPSWQVYSCLPFTCSKKEAAILFRSLDFWCLVLAEFAFNSIYRKIFKGKCNYELAQKRQRHRKMNSGCNLPSLVEKLPVTCMQSSNLCSLMCLRISVSKLVLYATSILSNYIVSGWFPWHCILILNTVTWLSRSQALFSSKLTNFFLNSLLSTLGSIHSTAQGVSLVATLFQR